MDVAYDFTRLLTRLFNVTPNGIDRVDFALAEHFLKEARDSFGVVATPAPRLYSGAFARNVVSGIATHWGEDWRPEADAGYRRVVAAFTGETHADKDDKRVSPKRIRHGRHQRLTQILKFLNGPGPKLGCSPAKHLPQGARYINVSQFPLWVGWYFEWLEARRDIRPVFFIHDLLPLAMPEHFRSGELARHRRRIANVARFASGVIVTSEVVREALLDALRQLGRTDMPVAAIPIPAAPVFGTPRIRDPRLARRPYFICCGTIEPRKNHLLLLNIWRKLVARDGANAPMLLLIGTRGWKYAPIVEVLEKSQTLREHVVEVSGLSTPAIKRLFDNARALLMPTFAEGYGLPVREALDAGLPVIASDIPAFREVNDARLRLLNPTGSEAWLFHIDELTMSERDSADSLVRPESTAPQKEGKNWTAYFSRLDGFVGSL